jgi:hypothetical protein
MELVGWQLLQQYAAQQQPQRQQQPFPPHTLPQYAARPPPAQGYSPQPTPQPQSQPPARYTPPQPPQPPLPPTQQPLLLAAPPPRQGTNRPAWPNGPVPDKAQHCLGWFYYGKCVRPPGTCKFPHICIACSGRHPTATCPLQHSS